MMDIEDEHNHMGAALSLRDRIVSKPAQSNLLISTPRGLQVSLLLVSRGELALGPPFGRLSPAWLRIDFRLACGTPTAGTADFIP
jgi:hypothetical protein